MFYFHFSLVQNVFKFFWSLLLLSMWWLEMFCFISKHRQLIHPLFFSFLFFSFLFFFLFFSFLRFYLFIWQRERARAQAARVAVRRRGRSRLPMEQGAQCEAQSQDPGIMTRAEGWHWTNWATHAPLHLLFCCWFLTWFDCAVRNYFVWVLFPYICKGVFSVPTYGLSLWMFLVSLRGYWFHCCWVECSIQAK